MGSESTLVGWGEPEFEFELLEAFRLALRSTLMTPSEVRAAGSSPLLVLMFLSALQMFRHDISGWSSALCTHPWLQSRLTMLRWFLLAAQWRAVHPLMSC